MRGGAGGVARSRTIHAYVGRYDKQYDTSTGLILMGARPYDPTTGRFLSIDPIDGGSLNNYDYCGQDPINCYDLTGEYLVLKTTVKLTHKGAASLVSTLHALATTVSLLGQAASAVPHTPDGIDIASDLSAEGIVQLADTIEKYNNISGSQGVVITVGLGRQTPHWYDYLIPPSYEYEIEARVSGAAPPPAIIDTPYG